MLIAPPVGMMEFTGVVPEGCDLSVVAGSADDFVDQSKLAAWPDANITVIEGADHFFSGYHDQLTQAIDTVIAE